MICTAYEETPVATRPEHQANHVWMRFHQFLTMGGFSVDNLPTEALKARFRETQDELLATISE
jgi:hypothetical protein